MVLTHTPYPRQRAADVAGSVQLSQAHKARDTYYLVPFEVPEGVTRIDVSYAYPKSENCVVDLGVADPDLRPFPSQRGLRGWSGGARDWFFLAKDAATPGYQPGPIQAGSWKLILGLYRLPSEPIDLKFEVRFSAEPRPVLTPVSAPSVVRPGPGWYRGDLQSHTFHSDAFGAPEHLHATARREQLDFLAVTDHNTTTQQASYFNGASSADLVFVPAYEFTTELGHGNVFGASEVFDFRTRNSDDVREMVRRIRASGALFSINHDKPTIPWRYEVPDIDCMEVWCSHWLAGNHISLARYQQRLAQGRRITAIGGSDFHQPAVEPPGNPFTLARPCTFLRLEELSVPAILEALRRGRSFVTESPEGPMLTIAAGLAEHGDRVRGGIVKLRVAATRAIGDAVHLWDATGRIGERAIDDAHWSAEVTLDNPEGFIRAEIVAVASRQRLVDELLAFLDDRRPGHSAWDESLDHPLRRAITSPIYVD